MTTLRFGTREIRDLFVAWIALGVAFALYFGGGPNRILTDAANNGAVSGLAFPLIVSLLTAGVGFLLHELAHKVVAVHYNQIAEFRADYNMLVLALFSAALGFLFAAPGAVYHHGRLTKRQHGLIALAGPVTNVLLVVVFFAVWIGGVFSNSTLLGQIGVQGVFVNLFLAAFNMIPYGPLDGRTVLGWSKIVWGVFFVPLALIVLSVFFGVNVLSLV